MIFKPSRSKPTCIRATTSPGVQRFLRDALKVIKAASDLSGDLSRALFWYRNESLSAFAYKTAEQLVSEGRTKDVLRYVTHLARVGRRRMIFTAINELAAYRMHLPKWAVTPLSDSCISLTFHPRCKLMAYS